MRHPVYPEYKESGVQWLGNVPEHWEVTQARNVFRIHNGSTPKSGEDEFWDGDVVWYTPEDLGNNKQKSIYRSKRKITLEGYKSCGTSLAKGNSIVLSTRAPIGHIAVSVVTACCNQGCRILEPISGAHNFWYYYFLSAKPVLQSLGQGSTFMELPRQLLASFRLLNPPLPEQTAIADFLDRETGRIDGLVAKKRRLIELLREKRTALISRTVTRGLPAEAAREFGLEPHTRFKDSGIDWLGEVPEGWILKAIKWETQVQRGASPRPIDDPVYFDDDGEYSWVRISDVTSAGMYLKETEQRLSELGNSLSVKLQPGSLFLSIAGTVGKPCITLIKCCIHDGFVYFPKWKGESRYLFYIFASGEPYKGLGKMGTQLNLNTDTVGSIVIGIPCIEEQTSIATYLDRETSKIDRLVEKVEAAIGRLQEYRTALITAAVTGKIDVREVVA